MNSANGVRGIGCLPSADQVAAVFPLRPQPPRQYSDFISEGAIEGQKALLKCVFSRRIAFGGGAWYVRWNNGGPFDWVANGDLLAGDWTMTAWARLPRYGKREWRGKGLVSLVAFLFNVPPAEVAADLAERFNA